VHLKSLTLRGFKSFASATTLHFEPGITCVVGPNGSGKSNVVDALAWVMGEQGAKSLRGGKMEDVIFAGTAGRPPLGRAEVVLTIDNADGALPIDYSEVTISRIMFRSGGSEYAINGNPCRLLDIQELLSDSGIGREMHVIVGQGQLDAVLSASPEERRGFIEEAAGVLKHRKRKEKALRKLDAMQANLTRLQDLTAEIRRQLGPLGRQAEVARKAATIQADVRDARLRLAADDLARLRGDLEREAADESLVRDRSTAVEQQLADGQRQEQHTETEIAADAPRLARAQETWYRLSSLRERLRGTATLAAERRRYADQPVEQGRSSREPEAIEAEAAQVRAEEQQVAAALEADRAALATAVEARAAGEAALADEERRVAQAQRSAADRREGLARLTGQVAAARSRVAAADEEIGRLAAALDEVRRRAGAAQEEFTALEHQVAGLDEGEEGLDARYEAAASRLAAVEAEVARLTGEEREAERERSALAARKEALELGLARKDGHGALLAAAADVPLLGSVAALLDIDSGYEPAVAAALGAVADAVAVASLSDAHDALALLKSRDGGRAGLLVGSAGSPPDRGRGPAPAGTWALDVTRAPGTLSAAVRRLLGDVVIVDSLDAARDVVARYGILRAVTREGDLIGTSWASGGSTSTPSLLEVQAAVDEASDRLAEAGHRCERLRFALGQAVAERETAEAELDAALQALHESDARMAAVAEELGQLGSVARAATGEADRLAGAIEGAEQARAREAEALDALVERLTAAEDAGDDAAEPSHEDRDRLAAACTAARAAELEARLAVRTGEERSRALAGRAAALEQAAAEERAARERQRAQRERRIREAEVAAAVAVGVQAALDSIETSLRQAADERDEIQRARSVREGDLLALRGRLRELAGELEQLTDAVHRDEVARTEQRLRIEALQQHCLEELGVDPETLLADYGPDAPVPVPPAEDGEAEAAGPSSVPYDRAAQEKRLRAGERSLALLGKVNPLALEEFSALEERHRFLAEQLEDLKKTRSDLLTVIREVDERVEQVFTAAWVDTAREFETVFATLFPGGEGRLLLTEPSDMLATGIEVEARPPGKKVKRLSLLSGGERSLTAVALLVAIFKARPSPFYVLDEVEAALDDVNLGRLLTTLAELRASSQLIVITHQKRTMEIADALYGVSMRGDGVTTVISQRLREAATA
jgi:chromosome segregation protein